MNISESLTLFAPWVGFILTLYYSSRQLKAATDQAKSSENTARLMQAQMQATFRPVVSVASGRYDAGYTELNLKNFGTGPAMGVVAIYPNRTQENLGDMVAGQARGFRYLHAHNHYPQRIVFEPHPHTITDAAPDPDGKAVTLRLEYQSVTGAKCWTKIYFTVIGSFGGTVNAENESGIDMPL